MAKYPVTWQVIASRYLHQGTEVISKLNSTKAGKKNPVTPEQVSWSFSWGEQIKSLTFEEVLNRKPEPELSIEEKLVEFSKNCFVWIEGSFGRRKAGSDVLVSIPQELLDQRRRRLEEDEAERKRVDALTPEERQAEIAKCLGFLSKSPGFFAITTEGK